MSLGTTIRDDGTPMPLQSGSPGATELVTSRENPARIFSLPPEIVAHICKYLVFHNPATLPCPIDARALLSLALTCRTFNAEANRAIYHNPREMMYQLRLGVTLESVEQLLKSLQARHGSLVKKLCNLDWLAGRIDRISSGSLDSDEASVDVKLWATLPGETLGSSLVIAMIKACPNLRTVETQIIDNDYKIWSNLISALKLCPRLQNIDVQIADPPTRIPFVALRTLAAVGLTSATSVSFLLEDKDHDENVVRDRQEDWEYDLEELGVTYLQKLRIRSYETSNLCRILTALPDVSRMPSFRILELETLCFSDDDAEAAYTLVPEVIATIRKFARQLTGLSIEEHMFASGADYSYEKMPSMASSFPLDLCDQLPLLTTLTLCGFSHITLSRLRRLSINSPRLHHVRFSKSAWDLVGTPKHHWPIELGKVLRSMKELVFIDLGVAHSCYSEELQNLMKEMRIQGVEVEHILSQD